MDFQKAGFSNFPSFMVVEIAEFDCLLDSRMCRELVRLSSGCVCELMEGRLAWVSLNIVGVTCLGVGDRLGPK